jgi:hypothetical protein
MLAVGKLWLTPFFAWGYRFIWPPGLTAEQGINREVPARKLGRCKRLCLPPLPGFTRLVAESNRPNYSLCLSQDRGLLVLVEIYGGFDRSKWPSDPYRPGSCLLAPCPGR